MFTDSYGEQSCTAGRCPSSPEQSVYRPGLSQVGIPAAPVGMQEHIVTIAACLKNQGYATGGFMTNHLGDLNSMLPTNHGFDQVLRQPLSFERRRRARIARLSQRKGFPELPESIRTARGNAFLGDRCGRPDRGAALGQSGQAKKITDAPARSPRSAWRPATTSSSPPPRTSSSDRTT